jgi:Domain of Unknown Function (DUF1080)
MEVRHSLAPSICRILLVLFVAALTMVSALQPQSSLAGPPVRGEHVIPYDGGWAFSVPAVRGARGYLWSFVQDGVIRWQNLGFEGRLSGRTYLIARDSRAHRALHAGHLWVWVRALLPRERWGRQVTLAVILRAAPAPTPTPAPPSGTPVPPTAVPVLPTATPAPTTGLLYEATANNGGLDKWPLPGGWKHLDGMLVSDGSGGTVASPQQFTKLRDIAVEAEIQLLPNACCDFGVYLRANGGNGYSGGVSGRNDASTVYVYGAIWKDCIGSYCTRLVDQGFSPGTDWHTYRLEARGNTITLFVDGYQVTTTTDNVYLSGGLVGLWAHVQLQVRGFRIIGL